MSIRIPHEHTLDISQGVTRVRIDKPFIYGDSQTHRYIFTVNDGNAAAVLTGYTATLYAVRLADKVTVPNKGTIDGNVVTIDNVQSDFLTRGRVDLLLTLSAGGEQVTLFWGEGTCSGGITDTIADPAEIIPTLSELLAQISAMETATGEAVAAAATANAAAASADTAAGNAQDAADAITGITIDAETLETGEPATASAEFDAGDGHLSVSLGLPKGGTGTRGSLIYRGTAITGTSITPAAYSTGITDAKPLDLYRYNGTDSANIGNIYECVLGGDAATALWAYAGNWRGAAGAGNVSFVDGVEPDGDGDVILNALRLYTITDANNAQPGMNRIASTGDNVPNASGDWVIVHQEYSSTVKVQVAYAMGSLLALYYRKMVSGSWGSWALSPAALVGINDAGGYFSASTAEQAFAEIGAGFVRGDVAQGLSDGYKTRARSNIGATNAINTTAVLPTSGWSGSGPYTYAATVAAVTSTNTVIAGPAPASKSAYEDCGAYVSAQGSGTLTFTAETVPTSAITVNVIVLNV